MLYKLIKYSDRNACYHEVISLMDEGVFGEKFQAEGIRVHSLGLTPKNVVYRLAQARHICKSFDVVNTWLYHADIFGFIVAKVLLQKKLIWNIRHSNLDKDANKSTTLIIVKVNSLLSKYVDLIVYNSKKALENHNKLGYCCNNSVVVPNGFELDLFRRDIDARVKVRSDLGLKEDDIVLITVGRWDIQKDYYTLLNSLSLILQNNIELTDQLKLIMVGTNLDESNNELTSLIDKFGIKRHVVLGQVLNAV